MLRSAVCKGFCACVVRLRRNIGMIGCVVNRRSKAPISPIQHHTTYTHSLYSSANNTKRFHRNQIVHASSHSSQSQSQHSLFQEVCSIKISVLDVPGIYAEELSDILLAEGATSTAIEEHRPDGAPEQKIFAHDNNNNNNHNNNSSSPQVWNRCVVIGYFPPEMDDIAIDLVSQASSIIIPSSSPPTILKDVVRAQDWEETIKESYQPIQISSHLWIVPSWADLPTSNNTTDSNTNTNTTTTNNNDVLYVILEPGLAFGTGDHHTTRLCLQWLSSLNINNNSTTRTTTVMDYGTGSGILAVASLLLGAHEAVGVDVEPLSIKAAIQNAKLNNVDTQFKALLCSPHLNDPEPLQAAGYDNRQFDIVVANILQGPLLELAPRLASYSKPGSILGLSGIMTSQTPAIIERYSEYYDDFEVHKDDTWAFIHAKRK